MKIYMILNTWYGEEEQQLAEIWESVKYNPIEIDNIEVIIIGNTSWSKENIKKWPVQKITVLEFKYYEICTIIQALSMVGEATGVYLFGFDAESRELAVRFAIDRKGSSLVSVDKLVMKMSTYWVKKKIFTGNLLGEYEIKIYPVALSVSRKGCVKLEEGFSKVSIRYIEVKPQYEEVVLEKSSEIIEQLIKLKDAEKVVIIGNGIKTIQDVEEIKGFAKKIGAQVGGTKPVIMQGLLPMEQLVGVSGVILNPKLCITIGVSGMAALYVGIENSEHIISINTDSDAPIMKKSDIIIETDWKKIIKMVE